MSRDRWINAASAAELWKEAMQAPEDTEWGMFWFTSTFVIMAEKKLHNDVDFYPLSVWKYQREVIVLLYGTLI